MKSFALIARLLLFLILSMITPPSADEVYSKTEAANRLYRQGKFEEALKLYEDALLLSPADPKLKMNKGSALYQLGDLESAEQSYEGALSAKEKKARANAHYNMGNILFRKGEALERQGAKEAQKQYKKALEQYIQSLDLQPSDYDAKWNLQLAHQRIKRMEQQQQQQQNKQDKSNNDNRKNQQDQQQKEDQQNGQQQQDKQQQDQEPQQPQKNEKEQQQQPAQEKETADMKKEEAKRIIELYADDADSLNRPPKKGIGKQQQPEKDW
ncbi:MAG: tetratricopeptide repeat protein [Chitinispirillaceae bacterium]|nr:tetratricopeptide repeat protein [Chitinispirillaceae bacterium]